MPDTNGRTSPEALGTAEAEAAIEAVVEAETTEAPAAGSDAPATAGRPRRRRAAKAAPSAAGPSTLPRVPVMSTPGPIAADMPAERISITQGGIEEAHATRIEVRQGGIGRAEADQITVVQGGLGLARAERVQVTQGALGGAIADRIELRQGFAQFLLARGPVRLEQGLARTVVAQQVEIGERGFAGLVIARDVSGGGRILLDWRAGLALGAAFALVWGLVRSRAR